MENGMVRAADNTLARAGEADPKVIESLVLRGDISGLGPRERIAYYVQMCKSLGLNAAAQPFTFLKLNGKEVLYAGRGCTDQLARIHNVTRELIDGPKVIDLAGTKLVYAVCKASMPNGRSETSVATLPLSDPSMVLMKCETKAKRRATLAILGLALLDESEVADIPREAKEGASQPTAREIEEAEKPTGSKAFATFVDRVVQAVSVVALMILRRALINGVRDEQQEPGEYLSDGDGGELGADSMICKRIFELGHRLTRADHTYLLTAEDDKVASLLDGQAGALAGKVGIDLKEIIVGWWLAHRGEVKGDAVASKLLYYALVRRWDGSDDEDPSGSRTKKARAQLDAAVKTASEPVANDAPTQPQARKVREVLPGDEEQVRAHVARYEHPRAIENAARKYAPMSALHRILAARLMAVSEPDDRGIRLSDIGALVLIERWGREGKIERRDAKPLTRVA